jgi:pyridoxamine 5'-phosphate oxidase
VSKDLLWQHGEQYSGAELDPSTVNPNPFEQFREWIGEAVAMRLPTVNAMALATISSDGWPSVRLVLLKEIDDRGLVFYTNYESTKASDLNAVPRASVAFHWEPLHRQIRVTGEVEKVSPADSDAYFAARPLGSQLGAIASPQSTEILDRSTLIVRVADLQKTYADVAPPRPNYWGGYRILPNRFEFWQGQPSRLHDRVVYVQTMTGWHLSRLAP